MCDAGLSRPIEPHEVRIWRFGLDLAELDLPGLDLMSRLSRDERERAARFRFEIHRRRFTAAHVAMRRILARHAGVSPESLRFRCDTYGKPALLPPHARIHFNLTHSHELGLLMIAEAPCGIDAEHIDRRTDVESLMTHVASEDERAAFAQLPPAERRTAFFRLWTRKEAYIKGRGLGLRLPLRAITVPVTALFGPAPLRVEAEWDDGQPWRLWDLEVPPPYEAALAYAGTIDRLSIHAWRPPGR